MIHKKKIETDCLWISSQELALPAANKFYTSLDSMLSGIKFGERVRAICEGYYSRDERGRPPIDPEVYFKMLMVGFFEDIGSERGIAYRCSDSLGVRSFLHYSLTEHTPDHSTLSVIRGRLPEGVYGEVFTIVLSEMKKQGLVKGKNLGFDTSVIEANASLKTLVNRMTAESYSEYVKKLAIQEGIDVTNAAAVANFDRKRKDKKVSNEVWMNPNDPDAKIGMTKDGATDMIYKPEHVVDLDTGAIVDISITAGDRSDTDGFEERIVNAQHRLDSIAEDPLLQESIESITGDKGYYKTEQLCIIREYSIKANIPDKIYNRNLKTLNDEELNAVNATAEFVVSQEGKRLLKKRGQYLERSFSHCLDSGGARRAKLRGRSNIEKRHFLTGAFFNISMMMRVLFGIGTPKQFTASKKLTQHNFHLLFYPGFALIVISSSQQKKMMPIRNNKMNCFIKSLFTQKIYLRRN